METKVLCATMFFVNPQNEILLFLRDDIPDIKYPNTWDCLGGHAEPDETPEEVIKREMWEELELKLGSFTLFSVEEFPDRIDYIFFQPLDRDISDLNLKEGQGLKWFSEEEIDQVEIAFGFKAVLKRFFQKLR